MEGKTKRGEADSSHHTAMQASDQPRAGAPKTELLGRKAVATYISWVLMMAFAVALSALMYNFMYDYAKSNTETIKEIVYNTDECRQAGLSVESACFDYATKNMNITIQNRNYVRLDKLDFRFYQGNLPLRTNTTEMTLNPNRNKLISIGTGLGGTQNVTYVEVIPRLEKDDKDIICSEKKAAKEVIPC